MLTRKSDLALRALRTVAGRGGAVRGEELASAIGTTRGFLVQVMSPLVHSHWVISSPGPLGGYRLRPGSTPSVLDVIESIEGPTNTAACVLDAETACASTSSGTRRPCAFHDPWLRARRAMRDELGRSPALTTFPASTSSKEDSNGS